jgi:hypothetical protein
MSRMVNISGLTVIMAPLQISYIIKAMLLRAANISEPKSRTRKLRPLAVGRGVGAKWVEMRE